MPSTDNREAGAALREKGVSHVEGAVSVRTARV